MPGENCSFVYRVRGSPQVTREVSLDLSKQDALVRTRFVKCLIWFFFPCRCRRGKSSNLTKTLVSPPAWRWADTESRGPSSPLRCCSRTASSCISREWRGHEDDKCNLRFVVRVLLLYLTIYASCSISLYVVPLIVCSAFLGTRAPSFSSRPAGAVSKT